MTEEEMIAWRDTLQVFVPLAAGVAVITAGVVAVTILNILFR